MTPEEEELVKILADTTSEYTGKVGATITLMTQTNENTPDTEWEKEKLAEQLHEWYLEATYQEDAKYNIDAVVPYNDLPEGSKILDRYIAGKIIKMLSSRDTYWKEQLQKAREEEREKQQRGQVKDVKDQVRRKEEHGKAMYEKGRRDARQTWLREEHHEGSLTTAYLKGVQDGKEDWKERVRKEVEGMKIHESHIGIGGLYTAEVQKEVNQALDTLLDNLK